MVRRTQWSEWVSEALPAVLILVLSGCAGPQARPAYQDGAVRFSIEAPESAEVTLVVIEGVSSRPALKEYATVRSTNGRRIVKVKLSPGEYRYFFRMDGAVVVDPEAPRQERDDFGGINGILTLEKTLSGSMVLF